MRADRPLVVNLGGKFCFLGEKGVVVAQKNAIFPTASEVEETLFLASERSVYSVENQIKEGFLTASCGERIGIAGSCVYRGGQVLAVRDVRSLCIRVPHEIMGCAEQIYRECFSDGLCSLLLLSPPGGGKTTVLRDLSRLICQNLQKNVLVCDERGELSAGDLGATADVIKFCDKKRAFTAAIRAMRPEVIVTDELSNGDYEAVKSAILSGICVLASAHLTKTEDVPQKIFQKYVLLQGLGEIKRICG